MLRNQKGFTLVELMVVVAIIGILAAIAIPQYNKFKGNSQLSNVQQMAKQIAKSAMSLGSTAQQNPSCSHVSEVDVDLQGNTLQAKDGNTVCDQVKLWDTKPSWVGNITITSLKVKSDGTIETGGKITVVSTYQYKGKTLGCNYDPTTDKLEDADGGYKCSLNF